MHTSSMSCWASTEDPTLGYRFIADELGDAGITASENRVW